MISYGVEWCVKTSDSNDPRHLCFIVGFGCLQSCNICIGVVVLLVRVDTLLGMCLSLVLNSNSRPLCALWCVIEKIGNPFEKIKFLQVSYAFLDYPWCLLDLSSRCWFYSLVWQPGCLKACFFIVLTQLPSGWKNKTNYSDFANTL